MMRKTFMAIILATATACPLLAAAGQAAPLPLAAATVTQAATGTSAAAVRAAPSSSKAPVTLAPIVVSAANTEPHIWTFQKGNSKVLVLGTIYPEPKGLDFLPFSINRALSESGAVIGPPWFDWTAHVGFFGMFKAWRESRDVTFLPKGKHLADVVPSDLMQRWTQLKAAYLPHNSKVDHMLPMYAGWKLYDAVLDQSGVAVKTSVPKLVNREAKKRGLKITDAAFHWALKDPSKAAKAFTPNPQADLVCFKTILDGIQGLPDASRTMASAWARGEVDTMQAYLQAHPATPPCWTHLTDEALAQEQGIDLQARERGAWLAALNATAAAHSTVFTMAPIHDIFAHTGVIGWLLTDGYTEVAATPAPVSTTGNAAVSTGKHQ